jgi:hypothetical protein
VTDNDPFTSYITKLGGRDLSSVSTRSVINATVLCSDGDVIAKLTGAETQVDKGSTDGHLYIGRDWTSLIEFFDEFCERFGGTVAFPVSSNEVLSFTLSSGFASGRSLGSLTVLFAR